MRKGFSWYVAHTRYRHEYRAVRELNNQGHEYFVPGLLRYRLFKGGEKVCSEPLFPRYLFIRLDIDESSWGPVRSTRGIVGLVAFGDSAPLPISDTAIQEIRDSYSVQTPMARLEVSDGVRFTSPKRNDSGLFGRVTSLDGQSRAVVLLWLLGRENRIKVDTNRLVL